MAKTERLTQRGTIEPGQFCPGGVHGVHDDCDHPEGAKLWLGGTAWAHPALTDTLTPVADLVLYPGNPRRGDQPAITASVADLGVYKNQITYQTTTRHVLTGNHTLRALTDLGAVLAPATAIDVPDPRAAAIVARDNYTSDQGSYDDRELLALLTSHEEVLALSGYPAGELEAIAAGLAAEEATGEGPVYSKATTGLVYEPSMEVPPPVEELVDRSKTTALIGDIAAADLSPEVTDFLIAGAQRHLVFDYSKIAEFYAHAAPEVQALMEASALVIIDFGDAAQYGYVQLSQRLTEILALDQAEREALDEQKAADGA